MTGFTPRYRWHSIRILSLFWDKINQYFCLITELIDDALKSQMFSILINNGDLSDLSSLSVMDF